MTWQLHRQVFEARFKPHYLFWDRSGQIVNCLLGLFPSAELVEAVPNDVVFRSPKDGIQMKFGPTMANIAQDVEEASAAKFPEQCTAFWEPFPRLCEIKSPLTRVGNRLFYRHVVRTESDAQDAVAKIARARKVGALFESTDRLAARKMTSFSFRLDDQTTAIRIDVSVLDSSLKVSPRVDKLIPQLTPRSRYCVQLDVDFFSHSPIGVDQLLVSEFLSGNKKLVENQILPIFHV